MTTIEAQEKLIQEQARRIKELEGITDMLLKNYTAIYNAAQGKV